MSDKLDFRELKGLATEIQKEASDADELLQKADAKGLRNIVAIAHKRTAEFAGLIDTLCRLYSDKPVSLPVGDVTSTEAMRDVALAAISFAGKAFAEPDQRSSDAEPRKK